MKFDTRWLIFQIGVPLIAPALLSALFVGAWETVQPGFSTRLSVILDLTPWAIVAYSLTLIGSTFDRSWSRLDKGALSLLWVAASANAVYYALLVIRRHDPSFEVRADAYYVTIVLMVASMVICYRSR